LIDTIKGKNITKDVLPGMDHNLSGTAGDFVKLLEKYLFNGYADSRSKSRS
jgi:hypothetical protein